jgi:hypothetical protein
MFALFSSTDPSLRIEFLRFREKSGIHVNKVIRLTNRGLGNVSNRITSMK